MSSLLLRLFHSEFFSPWIAVSYLFRYPDNIGIQHYLCDELKRVSLQDIQFFLPQLWYPASYHVNRLVICSSTAR
jgi:phosphatidylinositol 4-kinase